MRSLDQAGPGSIASRYGRFTLAAIGLATLPVLFGGLVWDDEALVAHNPLVLGTEPLWHALTSPLFDRDGMEAFYRPVVSLSLALVGRLWGTHPAGFHLLGWGLHLTAAWLCLRWLAARTAALSPESDERMRWLALCVATATFALHPARAQAVAWISGLGDVYLCVFGLAAALLLEPARRSPRRALAFGLCCALALGSKEAGIAVLPWLVVDHLMRHGVQGVRARALSFTLGAVGVLCASLARALVVTPPEASWWVGGATGLLSRVLVSLGYVTRALLWPVNMRVQLNYDLHDWTHLPVEIAWLAALGAGVVVGLGLLAAASWRRPSVRPWLADALTYFVLLGPTLNLVVIGTQGGTLSERYLTLPSVGASALLARGLLTLRGRAQQGASAVALAATLGCAALLAQEVRYFQSTLTLFTHFAEQDPRELSTLDRLQRIHLREGRPVQARAWALRRFKLLTEPTHRHNWAEGQQTITPEPSTRAAALLAYLQVETRALSDAEQARLATLRDALDALARGQGERVRLGVGTEPFELEATASVVQALDEAGMGDALRRLRARLHARTLDLEGARRIAGERVPSPEASAQQLQLALWAGDLEAAHQLMAALPPAQARGATQALTRLAAVRSPVAHAVQLAATGWPAGARAALDQLGLPPAHPARAEVDLLDGRPDLALTRLPPSPEDPRAQQLVTEARAMLERRQGLRTLAPPF